MSSVNLATNQVKLYSITNLAKTFCVVVREHIDSREVNLYSLQHHKDVVFPMLGVKRHITDKAKIVEDIVTFSIPEVDDGEIPTGKFHGLSIIIEQ